MAVRPTTLPGLRPRSPRTGARESSSSWPRLDRLGLALCWGAGLLLCLLAAAIVLYMLVKGLQFMSVELFTKNPTGDIDQSKAGGFKGPIIGTFILTVLGTVIAVPIGIGCAVWLSEYARPRWLARAVESGVEMVAGTPSVVLALFGVLIFSQGAFAWASSRSSTGAVFGASFIAAGVAMSLIALPLIVGATREALQAIPSHVREASYALGKTRAATIRRVLLPAARPGMATGASLGMGRIAGDTAIAVLLLGITFEFQQVQGVPAPLNYLKGAGSTLTTYVYGNSPAGEGNAPEKAYAAAFVLLLIVVLLNFGIDLVSRKRKAPSWNV